MHEYPPDRRLGVFASPAVDERAVYIASDRLLAIDVKTGKQIWERIIGEPKETFEYFWAPPLIQGGRLYAGASDGSETETRFDAIEYVHYLRRRWGFIAAACAVAIGLAVVGALLMTKRYTATATILIEAPDARLSDGLADALVPFALRHQACAPRLAR